MITAMTQAHWIAVGVGAVVGALIVYLLVRHSRQKEMAYGMPFETNGEADLRPTGQSFADVKDTF